MAKRSPELDDGMSVTPTFLKEAGFVPDTDVDPDEPDYVLIDEFDEAVLTLTDQGDCWSAVLGYGDNSYGNWPHDIRTRGQLRLLCEALGNPIEPD